jgi:DNA-binding transcriptional LysR family regulator
MELRHLQTFRQVAEAGSFTRAAAALGYVQSNVTAHIQALEAELGVPLFDRLGRQVRLTGAGQQLQGYAARILALADEARRAVSESAAGVVTITAPETLCIYRLPALLRAARAQLPQVRVVFRPLPGSEMRRAVQGGEVDVAFTLETAQRAPGLCAERLTHEPVALLVSPDHQLAGRRVGLAELSDEPLLLTEQGCAYRRLFEQALAEAGVAAREQLEFSSVEAVKQCALSTMGVAVLPEIAVAGQLARGELLRLAWAGPPLAVTAQMVWHGERWCAPPLAAFMALARATLADNLHLAGEASAL